METKCCSKNEKLDFSVLVKYILGLALLITGGWLFLKNWDAFVLIFRGVIGLLLILTGAIFLAIAK